MICNCCLKEFDPPHFNSKCCSDECRLKSKKRAKLKYKKSEKGLLATKKWQQSDRFKDNEKKYRQKDKAKKLAVIRSKRCFASSKKLQEAKKIRDREYSKSEKGRNFNKIAQKKYRQTEKGKFSVKNLKLKRRQAEKKGNINLKDWKEKLKLYNNSCASCGNKNNIEMDHIIPLSKNGLHHIDNVQPLCRSCNASKGNRLNWEN